MVSHLHRISQVSLYYSHNGCKQLLEDALILPKVKAEQKLTAGSVYQQLVNIAEDNLCAGCNVVRDTER